MAHGDRSGGAIRPVEAMRHKDIVKCNLAEIIVPPVYNAGFYAGLSLMVWILKREVRAFGGCLGMYRRRRTWHAAISVGEL